MSNRCAKTLGPAFCALFFFSCENLYKDSYSDTSPTSGRLKIYYDEGLRPHIINQVFTFGAQYSRVEIEPVESNDDQSISALLNDSCEAIVISRLLSEEELRSFRAKKYDPKYSHVATSGIALITSTGTPVRSLSPAAVRSVLAGNAVTDSAGNPVELRVLIDRNNSSVMRYLFDSITHGAPFGTNCSSLGSTASTIDYVAQRANTIAIIDFAWLSDRDDSLFKTFSRRIRYVGITDKEGVSRYPSQSSFKLENYPFSRKIYVVRKTGDFTLAKGFQSFVAGPKGQLTFLKQGLLPAKQAERNIEIRMEAIVTE